MKNKIKKSVALTLAALAAFGTFAGCTREREEDSIVVDGKTINIRVTHRGYGSSYIYKLAEQFNELYKENGFKANVLVPPSELSLNTVFQEIYEDKGIDLYYTNFVTSEGVVGEYGQVAADITDLVFNQKPIRFDGTEEEMTVADKLNKPAYIYDYKYDGKCYGLPFVYSTTGLGVNIRVLEEFNLELPRTSKELFDCMETIMAQASSTGIFPVTYSLTSGYMNAFVEFWMAQYGGMEEVKEFWTMQDAETGANLEKPYEVFGTESIEKAFTEFYRIMDYNVAAFGSTTQDFKTAQNQWMQGDAVFHPVGDWAYNEEKIRNAKRLDDIVMTRIPVISALGEKMFGAKTSYGYTADKCEEILCAIIDGVDANKNVDVITSEVNAALNVSLNEADVKVICERCSYSKGITDGAKIIVSEKSKVKDICALFLRMMASDDGAEVVSHEMMTTSPFNPEAVKGINTRWHQSLSTMVSSQYGKRLSSVASGYRHSMHLTTFTPLTGDKYPTRISEENLTVYDNYTYEKVGDIAIFATSAKTLAESIYNHAKKQWEDGRWS